MAKKSRKLSASQKKRVKKLQEELKKDSHVKNPFALARSIVQGNVKKRKKTSSQRRKK